MEKYNVNFVNQNKEIRVKKGTALIDAIREAEIPFDFLCGGYGKCGKCKVEIEARNSEIETVLACHYRTNSSLKVFIKETCDAQFLSEGIEYRRKDKFAEISDRSNDLSSYVAAFDLGTTSLAGYLLDKENNRQLAVTSRFNPQRIYGADVISRAHHEAVHRDGRLAGLIRKAIDEMLEELAVQAGIEKTEISEIMFVGNTCMHHLFLGISPESLLKVPYSAAMIEAYDGIARDYQLCIAPEGRIRFLPNLAGFVGADTVGCLLAIDFFHEDRKTLMIDIGTNGELVMGTKSKAYTCSTAAGPALEGARITCGMRGMQGAIQHITVNEGELSISVIGETEPIGICGSGLIDAIAVFCKEGLIDVRGRIQKNNKLTTRFAQKNAWRIKRENGTAQIALTDKVVVTQQDIREVQLAKSAIASGIQILCQKLGWKLEELEQILVAGAFGNYMNLDNVCAIGLLPAECRDRTYSIGNAAGEGAKIAITDNTKWEQTLHCTKNIEFVELASEKEFQNAFVRNLNFHKS